jgi:predicted nucleic acid-binding protein
LPAIRHGFADSPLPTIVVVDSSFVFDALVDSGQGRHAVARAFADRLRAANSLILYSSLIFLEAPQCWRRLYKRGLLVPAQRGLDLATDRMNAFTEANAKLEQFLAAFNRHRVNITQSLMQSASAFAASYDLNSHDALIVAVLRDFSVSSLVAIDRDFRPVAPLQLWDGLLIP